MYAVIEIGGKQYGVKPGDAIAVEKIDGAAGGKISIEKVLLISDGENINIGKPNIAGAKVLCDIISQSKGKKTIAFTFRRRKGSKRKIGHRQQLTHLKVKDIEYKG